MWLFISLRRELRLQLGLRNTRWKGRYGERSCSRNEITVPGNTTWILMEFFPTTTYYRKKRVFESDMIRYFLLCIRYRTWYGMFRTLGVPDLQCFIMYYARNLVTYINKIYIYYDSVFTKVFQSPLASPSISSHQVMDLYLELSVECFALRHLSLWTLKVMGPLPRPITRIQYVWLNECILKHFELAYFCCTETLKGFSHIHNLLPIHRIGVKCLIVGGPTNHWNGGPKTPV